MLDRLDLTALRGELDVAAQSGVYPLPAGSSIVHTEPPTRRPELQARLAELLRKPVRNSRGEVVGETYVKMAKRRSGPALAASN